MFKENSNRNPISAWELKRLSGESITTPSASNNNVAPVLLNHESNLMEVA